MAFSNSDVPAADVARLNRNIAVANPGHVFAQTARFITSEDARWNRAGDFTDVNGDESASGFPASRAYDELTSKLTKPDAARTTWYWMFSGAAPFSFDSLFIIGHNFGSMGTTSVKLQIANVNTFVGAVTIATFTSFPGAVTGFNESRLVSFNLDHTSTVPQIYSDVEFYRLEIIVPVAQIPEFREVILSEREQLFRSPLSPHDPQESLSETRLVRARGGSTVNYEFHRGRGEFNPQFIASRADSDEEARLTQWYRRTEQGRRPFIWTPDPDLNPSDSYFAFFDPPELAFPLEAGNRRTGFNIVEQGPFFRELERQ